MGAGYIHLTAKSSFSLLEGMAPVKKLAKAAAEQGFPALGITELGNVFSAVEASKHLAAAGVQPILGAELPLLGLPTGLQGEHLPIAYLTLLVQNETGWRNLSRLISQANMRKHEGLDPATTLQNVLEAHEGLIALSGAYNRGWTSLGNKQGRLEEYATPLAKTFANRFYIQLERHGTPDEAATERTFRALATHLKAPLVATNDSRFIKPKDKQAFEVLVGIGDGTTMDDPARRRFTANHHLRSAEAMLETFADLPSATANTVQIAKRCAFLLSPVSVKKMFLPKWTFSGDKTPADVIREEAALGLAKRLETEVYPNCADEAAKQAATEKYVKQLEFELNVIIQMGYDSYFLITSDFIRWGKSKGIPVGPGRGSGAGSVAAWALDITDLDPIRWELYFERFLNPDRISLPDFDVDFCQDRREEVIKYVQERFGADRVSQIITFGTLKARACLRDVGRVMGLPYGFVGQIAAFIPEGAKPPTIKEVLEADERLKARYDEEEDVQRLVDTAMELEGCYRHASTHAAGVIITDRPIADVCGLYVDPRSPMPATQFSMNDAEYAGLVKFDFLGLKTLSVIRMAENMLRATTLPNFDIMRVSLSDEKTYDIIRQGYTLGIFQIESAGMADLAKKMKAADMEALSALIALYRPGPMEWIPRYVACRLGQEEVQYPHPLLKDTLEVTFGIAVYQEQVMQMARVLAGYTLAGADMLRRAMGKKKPEEMAKERVKFVEGAKAINNIDQDTANNIFDQMSAFAGYGFNKAHSMAYALISFHTAYLKAHHPLEFMAATMTYDRGNTDKLLKYKTELERMGFKLLPADVNTAQVMFSVEPGAVRHALAAIKGAGEEVMRLVVREREANGTYKDIWDFLARHHPHTLNKRQLEVLAKSGALDSLNTTNNPNFRSWLITNLDILTSYGQANEEQKASGQGSLFGGGESSNLDSGPFLQSMQPPPPLEQLEQLAAEQETLGFYMSSHPLSSFGAELKRITSLKPAAEVEDYAHAGGGPAKLAVIVHSVREVKTKSGNRMGILLVSDPTGQTEVVLFPEAYAANQALVESNQPLLITVKIAMDGERLRVSADALRPLSEVLGERRELVLTFPASPTLPATLEQVKHALERAEQGPTHVKLLIPANGSQAVLRMPRTIRCHPNLLTNLRGLGLTIA